MEGEYGRSLQNFLEKIMRLGVELVLEEGEMIVVQLEGQRVIVSKKDGVFEARPMSEIDEDLRYHIIK